MAKFYGIVGYATTENVRPGVYTPDDISERTYYGDVTKNVRRVEGSEQLNDNLILSNTISIVADQFAYDHFFAIRYVVWMGVAWKVTNVEVKRPRLILTVGEVYNGPTASASNSS